MLHRLRSRFWAWAIIAPLTFGGHPVLAAEREEIRVTVVYGDLDLTRAPGVATLQRRISRALRDVCGEPRGPLALMVDQRRCVAETAARADAEIARLVAQARRERAPRTFAATAS